MSHKQVYSREIILDFGKTGYGKTQWARGEIKKHNRVIILDPLQEYNEAIYFDNLDELVNYIETNKIFRVSYSNISDFDIISDIVKLTPQTLLVVEESQRIIPPKKVLPPSFEDIVYRGRHWGTSLLLIAQRASTVNIAVRSQYNRLITFRQTEHSDIDWIVDCSGFDLEEKILALQPLEYLEITPKDYQEKKIEKIIK